VIIAATKVIFYAAPPSYWPRFVHPLMRLLMASKEVERVVIVDLIIITKSVPVSCLQTKVGFSLTGFNSVRTCSPLIILAFWCGLMI